MARCDYAAPWYHGSPEGLTVLRAGSWLTQLRELAKAFAHKPTLIQFGEADSVQHDGQQPGFLYVVDEPVGPDDVTYLRNTADTHWQTSRDLRLRLVAELPPDDPPQLAPAQIGALRQQMPKGSTGFVGDPDPD